MLNPKILSPLYLKLNAVILTSLISLTVLKSHAQDVNEMDKMELVKQVMYERDNGLSPTRSFKLWQTSFYLNSYSWSDDLSQFDFDLYEKITMSGRRYGLIKHKTDTLTKALFELVHGAFKCGIVVSSNSKLGFVDTSGKLIVPMEFDEIKTFDFQNGFVRKNGKFALVNSSGKVLTPYLFDDVAGFSDDICLVAIGNKYGYINRLGQNIVTPQFNNATHFFNGFAKIYFDKWEQIEKLRLTQGRRTANVNIGYTQSVPFLINKKGLKVFTGEDGDDISISDKGFALIGRYFYNDGDKFWRQSVIDINGKEVISFQRNYWVKGFMNDWIIVMNPQTKLLGLVDFKGKELLKPSFVEITPLVFKDNTLAKAFFDKNNFMFVDKDGKCISFDGVACPPVE